MSEAIEGATQTTETPSSSAGEETTWAEHGGASTPEPVDALSFDEMPDVPLDPYSGETIKSAKNDQKKVTEAAKPAAESERKEEKPDGEENQEGRQEGQVKPANAQEKPKLLKGRSEGKDVELRADTELPVTIAGKKETVKIQDLLNNYSGKISYDQKFSALDRDRKTLQAEKNEFESVAVKLHDLAVKGNKPLEAIELLASALGADPRQVRSELESKLKQQIQEEATLSDSEKENRRLKDELEFRKRQDENRAASAQRAEDTRVVTDRVQGVREKHGLDEATFVQLYTELKDSGQIPIEQITPELVGDYHSEMQSRHELGTLISKVNPDLPKKVEAVQSLRQIMRDNPSFSMKDIEEIAREVYGPKDSKALRGKIVGRERPGKRLAPRAKEDPINFDDI